MLDRVLICFSLSLSINRNLIKEVLVDSRKDLICVHLLGDLPSRIKDVSASWQWPDVSTRAYGSELVQDLAMAC